jgi:hypothetical protein
MEDPILTPRYEHELQPVRACRPASTLAELPSTVHLVPPGRIQTEPLLGPTNVIHAPLLLTGPYDTAPVGAYHNIPGHNDTNSARVLLRPTGTERHPWYKLRHHPKAFAAFMAILGILLTAIFSEPSYRSAALAKVGNAYTKIGNWMAKQDHELNVYDWCEAHPVSSMPGDTILLCLTDYRSLSMALSVPRLWLPCVNVWEPIMSSTLAE